MPKFFPNTTSPESIKIRIEAKEALEAHNTTVTNIWKIDCQLAKASPSQRPSLLAQRQALQQQQEDQGLLAIYEAKLAQAKEIEIGLFGTSTIGSSSPYILA